MRIRHAFFWHEPFCCWWVTKAEAAAAQASQEQLVEETVKSRRLGRYWRNVGCPQVGKGSFEVVMEYGSMVDVGRRMVAEEARESDIGYACKYGRRKPDLDLVITGTLRAS